ncbi:MAG: hypothetical protein ABTR07_09070 [Candidatus Competibacter denitrificans]
MSRNAVLSALADRLDAKRAPWPAIPDLAVGDVFTLVIDGAERIKERDYGVAWLVMTVEIRRATRFQTNEDIDRADLASDLLESLIPEVYGTDRTLGGACLDMRYVEGDTLYPADGTDLIAAVALFEMDYTRPE